MIYLYRDEYSTDEVLRDIPYRDSELILYPIKVKDYDIFMKYISYILYSKKHLKLDKNINLMEYVIAQHITQYSNSSNGINHEVCLNVVVDDLENLFSLICRQSIKLDIDNIENNGVCFTNQDKTIHINKDNFNKLRRIVLKQNVINEPKIFSDKFEEKIAQRWLDAQNEKNKNALQGFGEMANFISCNTSKSYDMLENENVLQLKADYHRCINNLNSQYTTILKTAYETTIVGFTDEVISEIYKDPYEGMWKDAGGVLGSFM